MSKRYIKNLDSNNIYKNYSIDYFTHSGILDDIATSNEYQKEWKYDNNGHTIDNWVDFFIKDSYYNNSGKVINPNSIIVSNTSNSKGTIYKNEYLLYYNYSKGLKRMTSLINLDNGLTYDKESHKIFYNIDNQYIKEINNKLYFNDKIFPIASNSIYGIAKINNEWFDINTGKLSIKPNILRSIRDIKNILEEKRKSLTGIYEYMKYIQDSDKLNQNFYEESSYSDEHTIIKEIKEEENINAYYFPIIKIYYKDNYWYNVFYNYIPKNPINDQELKKEDLIRTIEIPHNNTLYVKSLNNIELIVTNSDKYYIPTPNISMIRNKYLNDIFKMSVVDSSIFKTTINKNLLTNTLEVQNIQYISLNNTSIENPLINTNFYNSNGSSNYSSSQNQTAINNYNSTNSTSLFPEANSNLAVSGSIEINN